MEEIWKDIKGYEGLYMVSNLGRVKSLGRLDENNHLWNTKILKSLPIKSGYMIITLYKDTKPKNFRIHRLVAQAFLDNPNNLPQVNHKDENKTNNCISNLEWCTASYNSNYGTRNQRVIETHNKNNSCRAEQPILAINIKTGERLKFKSQNQASRELCVNVGNICQCLKGRRPQIGGYKFFRI